MADASIDQLRIHIESDAANASSGVRQLASDLSRAGNSADKAQGKLSGVADAINRLANQQGATNAVSSLADAVSRLNGVKISSTIGRQLESISSAVAGFTGSTNAGKIRDLASSLSGLSNVKISSTIGNQIPKIASSLRELDSVKVDTQKFSQLADSLNKLGSVQKNSLSSTVNALRKLPEAVSALRTTDLDTFAQDVQKLTRALNAMPASAARAAGGVRGASSANGTFASSADKAASSAGRQMSAFDRLADTARKIYQMSSIIGVMTAVSRAIAGVVNATNEYVEDMNLFNVSLGKYADQAQGYADKVSAIMGIEPQEWMRTQGTFDTMISGMGVASDKAATMSQQLTQLGYDLASFYNISVSDAMEKIRSGLSGEIMPLRQLGYDLSEARLQEEAFTMGITENVSEMTQSEKAMLRYHAMLTQVSWAQGDMARTLESPANMLRVFQANVHSAAVSIGKVFLPVIKAILPLATAAAKAVATLGNMIANLTGGQQLASVDYSGSEGVATPSTPSVELPDDDSGSKDKGSKSNPTAKKYTDVGNAAKKAAKDVKELKREVMSFDEINKFSPVSDTDRDASGGSGKSPSSGNGKSGSGKSGKGSGSGGGGAGNIPIQTYDFLGNATNQFDDLYDKIMDFVGRCMKAWDPLIKSAAGFVKEFEKQFEGLDIAGAAANAFVDFQHLVSNMARNVIETIGPMILAFNFPETIALAFDGVAQMCLTLSSAINDVGTFLHNFVVTGLLEFVDFMGKSVRGAILAVIEELSKWQTWFQQNIQAFADLGAAAGRGAKSVLDFAQAVASPLFDTAATVFHGLNDALRTLLGYLVNSQAAQVAATNLGRALTIWALGSALSAGLNGIASMFNNLATVIENRAYSAAGASKSLADTLTGGLPTAMGNVKNAAGNLGAAIQLLAEVRFNNLSTHAKLTLNGMQLFYNKFPNWIGEHTKLGNVIDLTSRKQDLLKQRTDLINQSLANHKQKLTEADDQLVKATAAYQNQTGKVGLLQQGINRLQVAQASANVKIAEGKTQMDVAKMSTANFTAAEKEAAAQENLVGTSFSGAVAKIAAGTAAKGAATIATGALTAAQGLLNIAINAFPGMILVTVFNLLLQALPNIVSMFSNWLKTLGPVGEAIGGIIDGVSGFIGKLFGLSDATGEVTDTTNEANQALDEEKQHVQDNVDSIKEYEKTHDNVKSAIDSTGKSVEEFSQYLEDNGLTFDDLRQKQEQYVDSTVNGFEQIDTSSGKSLSDVNSALKNNNDVMSQWSNDIQGFAKYAKDNGIQNADALVGYIQSAGPEKMSKALHEFMANPASAEGQEFLKQLQEVANQTDPTMAMALQDAGSDQSQAAAQQQGEDVGNAYGEGVDNGGQNAQQTAQDVDDATVQKFGSHYGEAKDAGRNLAGGFGDGVREASADATQPAIEASQAVVNALNGGNGYQQALSAGRNLIGGFGDGIKQASTVVVAAVHGILSSVVNALNGGNGYNQAMSAGANLIGGYGDGLQSGVNRANQIAQSLRSSVVNSLNGGSGYSGAKSAGANLMGGYGDGLQSGVNRANQIASTTKNSVNQNLNGGTGYNMARNAGANMMGGFADGLQSGVSRAKGIGKDAARQVQDGLGSNYNGAKSAGRNEMGGFGDGLNEAARNVRQIGVNAAKQAQDGLGSNHWGAYSAGSNLGWGFNNGLNSVAPHIYATAHRIASFAASMMRVALSIHSPSRVSMKIGQYFGLGFANGIEDEMQRVGRVSRGLAEEAVGRVGDMREQGRSLGEALGSGIGDGFSTKSLSDAVQASESLARRYVPDYQRPSRAVSSVAHVSRAAATDDDAVRQLANAVEVGVLNARLTGGTSQTNQGDTTIVLRIGNEDIARANIRGRESLASRGLVEFE